eukprot:jgi/Mesvir1/1474/Mv14458-RA.1
MDKGKAVATPESNPEWFVNVGAGPSEPQDGLDDRFAMLSTEDDPVTLQGLPTYAQDQIWRRVASSLPFKDALAWTRMDKLSNNAILEQLNDEQRLPAHRNLIMKTRNDIDREKPALNDKEAKKDQMRRREAADDQMENGEEHHPFYSSEFKQALVASRRRTGRAPEEDPVAFTPAETAAIETRSANEARNALDELRKDKRIKACESTKTHMAAIRDSGVSLPNRNVYAVVNETLNRTVTGMPTRDIRELHQMKKSDLTRDFFTDVLNSGIDLMNEVNKIQIAKGADPVQSITDIGGQLFGVFKNLKMHEEAKVPQERAFALENKRKREEVVAHHKLPAPPPAPKCLRG